MSSLDHSGRSISLLNRVALHLEIVFSLSIYTHTLASCENKLSHRARARDNSKARIRSSMKYKDEDGLTILATFLSISTHFLHVVVA